MRSLFRGDPHRSSVLAVYRTIVERARIPVFYTEWGVPDSLDGRFEVLALHVFLVLERLTAEPATTADFAQSLFDTLFADIDHGMREMGAGDLGVGRHVKTMARSFYGRVAAYREGLDRGAEVLADALRRNLFGTVTPKPHRLATAAAYVERQAAALAQVPVAAILGGAVAFTEIGDVR